MPSSYQVVLWKQESFLVLRPLQIEFFRNLLERSNWTLAAPPDYDATHKNWEYQIKTVDIEGVELGLKIAPNPVDGTVIVITKF
jgi:hypothetical protein